MLLAFFDSKGVIYSHIDPKGSPVNSKYIVKALGNFLKQVKKKRLGMVEQKWSFHWDNAPVHKGRCHSALVCRPQHLVARASTLFAGPGSGGVLLVRKVQGGAGLQNPGRGNHEEDLGLDHSKHGR
jgi:hypothetical protein